jgi:hypothetical protein
MAAKSLETAPVNTELEREEGEVSWDYLKSRGVILVGIIFPFLMFRIPCN